MPAAKVCGARGELTVRITIQNRLQVKETLRYRNARGEMVERIEEFFVPFAVNVSTDVPSARFRRIEAPGATTTAAGATVKVSWIVFPYPTAEVTLNLASGTGIALEPIYFAAAPTIPPLPEFAFSDRLADLDRGIGALDAGLAEMAGGAERLYAGQGELLAGIGALQAGVADLARLNETHREIAGRCLEGLGEVDPLAIQGAFGRLAEFGKGLGQLEEGISALARLNEAHRAIVTGIRGELERFDLAPVREGVEALSALGEALTESDKYLGRAASSVEIQARHAVAARNRQDEISAALEKLAKNYPAISGASEYRELKRLLEAQAKDLSFLTNGGREAGKSFDGLGYSGRLLRTMVERVEKGREGLAALKEFSAGAGEAVAGLDRLKRALGILAEGGEVEGQYVPGLKAAAEGLDRAREGAAAMRKGVDGFAGEGSGLLAKFQEALVRLRAALGVLLGGGELEGQRVPGLDTAGDGLARVAEGLIQVRAGIEASREGTRTLAEGANLARAQGTAAMGKAIGTALDELAKSEALKRAVAARVRAYDHFIGKPAGAKGEVRFLLRTEALR